MQRTNNIFTFRDPTTGRLLQRSYAVPLVTQRVQPQSIPSTIFQPIRPQPSIAAAVATAPTAPTASLQLELSAPEDDVAQASFDDPILEPNGPSGALGEFSIFDDGSGDSTDDSKDDPVLETSLPDLGTAEVAAAESDVAPEETADAAMEAATDQQAKDQDLKVPALLTDDPFLAPEPAEVAPAAPAVEEEPGSLARTLAEELTEDFPDVDAAEVPASTDDPFSLDIDLPPLGSTE